MIMTTFLFAVATTFGLLNGIRINTKLGEIEGITGNNSVDKFFNIPYAEPPVGPLRWKPTKSLINDKHFGDECYDATKWGNACPQPTYSIAFSNDTSPQFIEDCLYLNVFTPYNFNDTPSSQKLRPVMVWIHGGGLIMGTSMTALYEPSNLVSSQDIVVVTINYRLGAQGFFIDPSLTTTSGGANGFLDMIEALKWVQTNIESFGGDPNEVTIAGESGGGWAVCGLVVSPLANGLFKRSIQMSGSCIKSWGKYHSRTEAYKTSKLLRDNMNATRIDELRGMDMTKMIDSMPKTKVFMPSPDGYVFPVSPLELMQTGHINGESVMIGQLFRESSSAEPMHFGYETKNETDFDEFLLKSLHDSQVNEIKKYYSFGNKQKVWNYGKSIFDNDRESLLIQSQMHTDCGFRCGSIGQTEIISSNPITKNNNVYYYQFGHKNEPYDQVTHGYDIPNLFGNGFNAPFSKDIWNDEKQEFSKMVMKFFGDYIKGIEPSINNENGEKASIQNGYYLQIVGDNVKRVKLSDLNETKKRCKVWDIFGDTAWRNENVCMGIPTDDLEGFEITEETMSKIFQDSTEDVET